MRRRRNPDLIGQGKDLVTIVAVGAGLYLLYQLLGLLNKGGQAATSMYNQTAELGDTTPDPGGQTWAAWYDPTQRIVFFYYLTFPDGNQHFVWASDVQPDGTFVYSGNYYRIGTDVAGGLRAYSYAG